MTKPVETSAYNNVGLGDLEEKIERLETSLAANEQKFAVEQTMILDESYPHTPGSKYSAASAHIEEPESNKRERVNAGRGKWLCLGLEGCAAAGALVANSMLPWWLAIVAGMGVTVAVMWVIGSGLLTVTNMRAKVDRLPFLRRVVKVAVFALMLSAVPVFLLSRVQALLGTDSDFWTSLSAIALPLGLIAMGLSLVTLGSALHALEETLGGWCLAFIRRDRELRHQLKVLTTERKAHSRHRPVSTAGAGPTNLNANSNRSGSFDGEYKSTTGSLPN